MTSTEVPTTHGRDVLRRADVVAVACWQSKCYRIVIFEVKASRADWLAELNHPEKRAPSEDLANECWFVAPAAVIPKDEVPEGWGLMTCSDALDLRRVKAAVQRQRDNLPLWFASLMMRRIENGVSMEREALTGKACWRYAGEELTKEQLVELALATGNDELHRLKYAAEQAVERERERIIEEFCKSPEYAEAYDVRRAAMQIAPSHWEVRGTTLAERLLAHCEQAGRLGVRQVNQIKGARNALAEVLGVLEGEETEDCT